MNGNGPRLAASRLLGFLQPGHSLIEIPSPHQVDPDVVIRPAELCVDLLLPQLGRLPQSLSFFHFGVPPHTRQIRTFPSGASTERRDVVAPPEMPSRRPSSAGAIAPLPANVIVHLRTARIAPSRP